MASSSSEGPSAEARQDRFEQAIALSLNLWPALRVAVQNNWGGPDSKDKRDWFAGAVAEQFPAFTKSTISSSNNPSSTTSSSAEDPDTEYIEELILQVMVDEFEVTVDDGSAFDVADEIVRLRAQCRAGNFADVDALEARWAASKGKTVAAVEAQSAEQDQDTDWDDTDGSDDDDDEEMTEAPQLVPAPAVPKEKPEPEVDEDGFIKVTRKR